MAVEAKRGCGYRKVGGIYLVSGGISFSCGKLPLNLHVCPTCSGGIKYSRGTTWINPQELFGFSKLGLSEFCKGINPSVCSNCPVGVPPEGKHLLLWVGKKFYTPESFTEEAIKQGISKRIPALPNDFKLGETMCYIAHLEAGKEMKEEQGIFREEFGDYIVPSLKHIPKSYHGRVIHGCDGGNPTFRWEAQVPAVFYAFKPTAIEKIITETESKDVQEMEKLKKRGITAVIVPDGDPDHMGSVHDKKDES